MDASQDEALPRISSDDERAVRLASLVLALSRASRPLSSAELRWRYYPGLSDEGFARSFLRDREALALMGADVQDRCAGSGSEGHWSLREGEGKAARLSRSEELLVISLCSPLVGKADFPYRNELRVALAKIDRRFDTPPLAAQAPVVDDDGMLDGLLGCMARGHAVEATYTNAAGEGRRRCIAPWGCFGLRDHIYFVGPELVEGSSEGEARVWRLDRFSSARETRLSVAPPEGFRVENYLRLPFQMGQDSLSCLFLVPQGIDRGLHALLERHGSLEENQGRVLWRTTASNVFDAASWGISQGLACLEPTELRDACRQILEGSCHGR